MDSCLSVVTMSNIHRAELRVTQVVQFPPGTGDTVEFTRSRNGRLDLPDTLELVPSSS
jgi:hypothetical protein